MESFDCKKAIETINEQYPSEHNSPLREALDLAVQALQKQIPTSPIKEKWSPSLCPSCGAELSESLGDGYYKDHITLKHCDCGQKLDWGLE